METISYSRIGRVMRNNDKDDDGDWGDDKGRRTDRYKRKTFKKDKRDLPKDMPSRVEQRQRPRRNRFEWQGNDYDYQEEFGEG
jgi:hypothetical protein